MITTKQIHKILKQPSMLFNLYNLEMDKIAAQQGEYKLDVETQLQASKKAFEVICKEPVNASYEECVSIFDIINRSK